jgi:hypothetical protein
MDLFSTATKKFYKICRHFTHKILIYLKTHLCFIYVCSYTDVTSVSQDDEGRSKYVGVTKNCEWKYNFNISAFVGFTVWIVRECTDMSNIRKWKICLQNKTQRAYSRCNRGVSSKSSNFATLGSVLFSGGEGLLPTISIIFAMLNIVTYNLQISHCSHVCN